MRHLNKSIFLLVILSVLFPVSALQPNEAINAIPPELTGALGGGVTEKVMVLLGLSLLPYFVMLFTSFLKIVIVLGLLRNAVGVQQSPPNQVINGIAILISIYVMFPTGHKMYQAAAGEIPVGHTELFSERSTDVLIRVADKAKEPLRDFMIKNSNAAHRDIFYSLGVRKFPDSIKKSLNRTSFMVLMPAYITSQLKSAFQIAVLVYLPFFVVDLVVSNVLLAMGMMMLSPLTISLPIKLFLLVMGDGWTILIKSLALSFR